MVIYVLWFLLTLLVQVKRLPRSFNRNFPIYIYIYIYIQINSSTVVFVINLVFHLYLNNLNHNFQFYPSQRRRSYSNFGVEHVSTWKLSEELKKCFQTKKIK